MTVEGLPQLRARLKAIEPKGVLRQLQETTIAEAKKNADPFHKTRFLQRNIVEGPLTEREAVVIARAPYSAFVEKGTGIYGPKKKRITPKNGPLLAWRTGEVRASGRSRTRKGKELAGWAFAKSVRGRKATPFLFPGARTAAKKLGANAIVDPWNKAA